MPLDPNAIVPSPAAGAYRATVREYVRVGQTMLDAAVLTGDAIPFIHGCLTLVYVAMYRGIIPSEPAAVVSAMDKACDEFAQEIYCEEAVRKEPDRT